MSQRTFSETEIQALLRRATQLHLMDEGDKPGLTLSDLEHIAADAGVPPQFLRAALHEADHQVSTRDMSGHTKTHVYIERTVPGELTESEWESVVHRLRKEYSSDMADAYGMGPQYGRGVMETLGNTREWMHTTSMGVVTTVTLRAAEGMQHLHFQRRVGMSSPRVEGIVYGFLLAMVTAGIVGGIAQSALVAVLVLFAATAMAAPLVERLDRGWRDKKLDEMKLVADDIVRLVRQSEKDEEAAREAEATVTGAPVLDLDDADSSTSATGVSQRVRE